MNCRQRQAVNTIYIMDVMEFESESECCWIPIIIRHFQNPADFQTHLRQIQCFDTVGWAAGRASGL